MLYNKYTVYTVCPNSMWTTWKNIRKCYQQFWSMDHTWWMILLRNVLQSIHRQHLIKICPLEIGTAIYSMQSMKEWVLVFLYSYIRCMMAPHGQCPRCLCDARATCMYECRAISHGKVNKANMYCMILRSKSPKNNMEWMKGDLKV